jgi:hypothetical protein
LIKTKLIVATSLAVLFSAPAFAAPKSSSHPGASAYTPHAQVLEHGGPLSDARPGASGFTPGYLMNNQTGTPATRGASTFAPGYKKR